MSFSSNRFIPAVLVMFLLVLAGAMLTGCVNEPSQEGRAWGGLGSGYSSPGSVSDREWK